MIALEDVAATQGCDPGTVRRRSADHASDPRPPADAAAEVAAASQHAIVFRQHPEGIGLTAGQIVEEIEFWITPADLKARRFDRVALTADAY